MDFEKLRLETTLATVILFRPPFEARQTTNRRDGCGVDTWTHGLHRPGDIDPPIQGIVAAAWLGLAFRPGTDLSVTTGPKPRDYDKVSVCNARPPPRPSPSHDGVSLALVRRGVGHTNENWKMNDCAYVLLLPLRNWSGSLFSILLQAGHGQGVTRLRPSGSLPPWGAAAKGSQGPRPA